MSAARRSRGTFAPVGILTFPYSQTPKTAEVIIMAISKAERDREYIEAYERVLNGGTTETWPQAFNIFEDSERSEARRQGALDARKELARHKAGLRR